MRLRPATSSRKWPFGTYEGRWDGFRAIVSTEGTLRVRSRRAWDTTERVGFLAQLPVRAVLDGELVALDEDGKPDFPLICECPRSGARRRRSMTARRYGKRSAHTSSRAWSPSRFAAAICRGARLDQEEEPRLLAVRDGARVSDQPDAWSGRSRRRQRRSRPARRT